MKPDVGYSRLPSRRTVTRWLLLAAPPLIFLLALTVRYFLAPFACANRWALAGLEIGAALALLIALGSGSLAWRRWRERESPGEVGGRGATDRMILLLASAGGAFFALVMLANWIPSWVLGPCYP